jgi:phosphopantothenoylcysteine synthetase/decarboxylase
MGKLRKKGLDLIVVNDVSGPEGAFGSDSNSVQDHRLRGGAPPPWRVRRKM